MYVYGQSPDFYPGSAIQKGNGNPTVKLKPKKSCEIKHNYAGSEHEMTVRSRWTWKARHRGLAARKRIFSCRSKQPVTHV